MITSDVAFFSAFTEAVERVVELTGNSGKFVRRVLEQYLPQGLVDVQLAAPAGLSVFAFASYIDKVREACSMANDALACYPVDGPAPATFTVAQVDLESRSYRLQIKPSSTPTSMRGRQVLLKALSQGMARLRVMLDPSLGLCMDMECQALEDRVFEAVYYDNPQDNTAQTQKVGIAQFQALAGGDYTPINDTPMILVALASLLNPAVDSKLCELYEAEAAMLDALYAQMDELDTTKDSLMPLNSLFSKTFEKRVWY